MNNKIILSLITVLSLSTSLSAKIDLVDYNWINKFEVKENREQVKQIKKDFKYKVENKIISSLNTLDTLIVMLNSFEEKYLIKDFEAYFKTKYLYNTTEIHSVKGEFNTPYLDIKENLKELKKEKIRKNATKNLYYTTSMRKAIDMFFDFNYTYKNKLHFDTEIKDLHIIVKDQKNIRNIITSIEDSIVIFDGLEEQILLKEFKKHFIAKYLISNNDILQINHNMNFLMNLNDARNKSKSDIGVQ